MDIKKQISSVADKLTKDKSLMSKFQKDPEKTVESIIGVDLPDGALSQVVDGVKAKMNIGKVADKLGGLKKLF